jgi:hypothetical protein
MNVINDIRSRARFLRSARPEKTAPPAKKPLTVAPGRGSYSLEAAAAILRTTPERLRAYTRNRVAADFNEDELRELWPVFRK